MRKSRLRGPGVEPFGLSVCRRNDTPQSWCSPHITDMTYTVHNRSHYSILPPATGIVSITGLCIRAYSRSCHSANTCVRVHACACVHALENVTLERAFTVWNHNFSSAEVSHCAPIISGQNNAASNKSNIKNGMWPVDSRAHWSFFKMRNKTHAFRPCSFSVLTGRTHRKVIFEIMFVDHTVHRMYAKDAARWAQSMAALPVTTIFNIENQYLRGMTITSSAL